MKNNPEFRCGTIAIVGRPNVGKSTLLNHLVGQKVSITSRKAQTTRHRLVGIQTEPDAQYIFVDTPGFQLTHQNGLNKLLNRTVNQVIADTDVIWFVLEGKHFGEADQAVLNILVEYENVILVINKIDQAANKNALLPFIEGVQAKRKFAAIVPISAKTGTQLELLKQVTAKMLPLQPPIYGPDDITDRSERFIAAEFVREKVFRFVGEELPYSTSVVIEQFELEGALRRIHIAIVVEKASQKAILIGAKGEKLKKIGTEARIEMERMFGGKVYLELWVRVKKGWADDNALLRQYGYE
jgi:GTPase